MDREVEGLTISQRVTRPHGPGKKQETKERYWKVRESFWWEEIDWRT